MYTYYKLTGHWLPLCWTWLGVARVFSFWTWAQEVIIIWGVPFPWQRAVAEEKQLKRMILMKASTQN